MPGDHPHRVSRSRRLPPSKLEITILVAGFAAAIVSGVAAYRIVGLYGDGPFASGYHRTRDPETGKSLLVHESRTGSGVVRRVIDGRTLSEVRLDLDADGTEDARVHVEGAEITRVDRDQDGDGRTDLWEYYDASKTLVKTGFSLASDGVVDAWAYRDDAGQVTQIEVSTRRDGAVDRWERYEDGQLARVELDADLDGRVDRWLTYEEGILVSTDTDRNGDGAPDGGE
jgi:hypothetical protein